MSSTLNPWNLSEGAIGFVVGMCAMLICEGILKLAKDWSTNPRFPGSKP
jgi:hypothetical protein